MYKRYYTLIQTIYEKQVKENLIKAGNNYGIGKEKPLPNLVNPISSIDTAKKLAEVANVGKESYRMGKKILDSDNEEVKEKVLSGEMSINAGYEIYWCIGLFFTVSNVNSQ